MKRTGDLFEGVAAVEELPEKMLLGAEQKITLMAEIFQDVGARAVGALRLRRYFPSVVGKPLRAELPMRLAAWQFFNLKTRRAGTARQQFKLGRFGHMFGQVDLRPNSACAPAGA